MRYNELLDFFFNKVFSYYMIWFWEEVNGMNKIELINVVVEVSEFLKKDVIKVVDVVFDIILEVLKVEDKV